MDEEVFNKSTRKYLRKLGVTTQREIESAVRQEIEAGRLRGDETLTIESTVMIGGISGRIVVPGSITLSEQGSPDD